MIQFKNCLAKLTQSDLSSGIAGRPVVQEGCAAVVPGWESSHFGGRQHVVAALICAAATVAALAPFITKAFHIDDTLFLHVARQISAHPWDPFGFKINWYYTAEPMADVTQNGPLASYYIALVASCFGWSEAALHLAFLVPAVLATMGTYLLAVQLCGEPLLAALVTILSPVFLVSSTNVMCDTMMLAFWVWGVFLWLQGAKRKSHFLLILSVCLISAAVVTKYFAISLFPLLIAYSLLHRQRLGWRILYLTIPVGLLLGYDGAMRSLYGHSLLFAASSYALKAGGISGIGSYFARGLTSLCFMGGCLATIIFFSPLLFSRRALAIGLMATAVTVWLLVFGKGVGDFSFPSNSTARFWLVLQMAIFAVAGFSLLWLAIADLWLARSAESALLLLWIVGTFVFCWILNWTINGRSILPMAPAASILIARRFGQRKQNRSVCNFQWEFVPLVFAGLLAGMVAWADMRLADSARKAAAEINSRFAAHKNAVLYGGHFGFQYYMESYGFQQLDEQKSRIVPGDVLILPENNTNLPELNMELFGKIGMIELMPCPILTTMQSAVGAGFYASAWGPLPFAFGAVPPERYDIITMVYAPPRF
jgi:4-amino-4-deoxy-L-arabinose transferase-like glycosyltransferase